jgi:hypothetical protein
MMDMTGMEIWGFEDGWKEIGKVHELFCKTVMGMPNTAANGACVKELGRINRKEKVMERVLRYWQRLWEIDETSLLGNALKQQSLEKGNNWLNKIKQELERLTSRAPHSYTHLHSPLRPTSSSTLRFLHHHDNNRHQHKKHSNKILKECRTM